jgi:hypothetical protein
MNSGIPGDPVNLARIEHQPELLLGIDEAIDHLNAVLHVDIVIARAMDKQ